MMRDGEKTMKKIFLQILLLAILGSCFFFTAFAAEPELLVETLIEDGSDDVITVGDIIEVSVRIRRTDADSSYLLYAIQDEIEYDTTRLTFLPDETLLWYGFQNGYRKDVDSPFARVLINYVDMSGQGVERVADFTAAKLKFRVEKAGNTRVQNQNVIATDAKGERRRVRVSDLSLAIQGKASGGEDTSGSGAGGTSSGGGSGGTSPGGGTGGVPPDGTGGAIPGQDQNDTVISTAGSAEESTEGGEASLFHDVRQEAWYYPAVCFVAEKGYLKGTGENRFSPDLWMTRAMFVAALYRMAGEPEIDVEALGFNDVEQGSWYEKALIWATGNDLVYGANGAFLPEQTITREQIAVILARYIRAEGYSLLEIETVEFADAEEISAWAYEDVIWMQRRDLIHGMTQNNFAPLAFATRAQVAQILHNFAQKAQG